MLYICLEMHIKSFQIIKRADVAEVEKKKEEEEFHREENV